MLLSTRILDRLSVLIFLTAVLILSAGLFLVPGQAFAMQPLAEEEMAEITGQAGFSEFTVDATTARMFLNISVETNAYIDEFKANYDPVNAAWDQEWQGVYLGEYDLAGEPVNPLILDGFIMEAEFDDITAASKRLLSLKMGFENVSGEISAADFASFTGYSDATRAGYYRASRGAGTFTFDNDRIHMIFDARGLDENGDFSGVYPPGIYFDFGNAEFN